jgi:S-adenosylmethionine-diacylglycerol 3-amino-3-carboxypropyl transferase
MHTEFENVDLNLIRYSLVWEAAETLYTGLNICEDDNLLMITSAGCNVLNVLLKNPKSITAIDLNPEQNRLLLFKMHVIEHHDYDTFSSIMGFSGSEKVEEAWKKIDQTLDPGLREHWKVFFKTHPKGIISSGKLESYILGFLPGLPEEIQKKVRELFKFEDLEQQYAFFLKDLDGTGFQDNFIEYFDRQNLSKGRDPKLFKYVKSSGGEIFYSRLKDFVKTRLLKNNFHLWFFMFGPVGIPEAILPPCYRRENFYKLKNQLGSLKLVTGEAIEFLMSPAGKNINKAGLSNIFEYVDEESFAGVTNELLNNRSESLRVIYWNLLQSQGEKYCSQFIKQSKSRELSAGEDCFYFQNVRLMKTMPKNVLISKST